jgi:hypothetical protein
MLIARASGIIIQLSLPALIVQNQYSTNLRAQNIYLNCDNSRLAIIDISGMIKIMEIDSGAKSLVTRSREVIHALIALVIVSQHV